MEDWFISNPTENWPKGSKNNQQTRCENVLRSSITRWEAAQLYSLETPLG
jgi:hypothetical protein